MASNLESAQDVNIIGSGVSLAGITQVGAATTGLATNVGYGPAQLSMPIAGSVTISSGTVSVSGTVPVSGTFWQATQPVSIAATVTTQDSRLPSALDADGGLKTHVQNWPATQPVSLATAPTTPVTGTFWQATQPVSGPLTDTQLRATAVPVSGTFWPATQPVSGTVAVSNFPGTVAATYKGRAGTFRIPGRAGTTGQRLMAIMNGVGSGKTVTINLVAVDTVSTVVKAVTVLPPVIRVYRITAVPTGGTAVVKVARDSSLASSASVTLLGDASADGTSSAVALTAVTTSGAFLTQEFAPRLITAAGYELFDRTVFFEDTTINLAAGEGLVVALDYTLATQNPTTDMWIVGVEWDEA